MSLLSFVLPAKNEAKYIGLCIDSIKEISGDHQYEIIVVDNGSDDDTQKIASDRGARVFVRREGTIGALRNFGVSKAAGDIIVFLDADVVLTDVWRNNISRFLAEMQRNPKLITGSHCFAPASDPYLFRTWFNSFASEPSSRHLGTGHMIVGRILFADIGGFSEILRTGEDYEFCVRAERLGAEIRNDVSLMVYHLDFPKTLNAFIRRESWHGRGDLQTLKSALNSKVVIAASAFFALHMTALFFAVLSDAVCVFVLLALIVLELVASSFAKFRHRALGEIITNAYVFYWYYWGRVLSIRYVIGR